MLVKAVYTFHPAFTDREFPIWFDAAEGDQGHSFIEGGDIMPIGNGIVLVGMGERSTFQAVSQIAKSLFDAGSAERVIAARMPKERAAMHLDTVFTVCSEDVVNIYEPVVSQLTSCHREWSPPTTATTRSTPICAPPASRFWRSPPASSAAAVAVVIA